VQLVAKLKALIIRLKQFAASQSFTLKWQIFVKMRFTNSLTISLKTTALVKIENLSVKAFLKNHKLAGAIADCGMFEFRRQLEYKCQKFSSQFVLVDRMFPSSQICSSCGNHRHKMPLKQRVYICPDCGHTEDRDLNAAKNIERWFEGIFIPIRSDQMASSAKITCGVDKPLKSHLETTVKQEVNSKPIQLSFDFA
jgi:Transposase and inactivated derivatives